MDWFLYDNGLRHERVKTYTLLFKMRQQNNYRKSVTYISLSDMMNLQKQPPEVFCKKRYS